MVGDEVSAFSRKRFLKSTIYWNFQRIVVYQEEKEIHKQVSLIETVYLLGLGEKEKTPQSMKLQFQRNAKHQHLENPQNRHRHKFLS